MTTASTSFSQQFKSNLESFFVMQQRQVTGLRLELSAPVPSGFEDYAAVVRAYNDAFDAYQACAVAYKADVAGQTRERAVVLDERFECLQQAFLRLEPVFLAVRERINAQHA